MIPLPLSSSYFTLDPRGISITAWNSRGTFSPGLRSCQGCIGRASNPTDRKLDRMIRQYDLATLTRKDINILRIDILQCAVLQIVLREQEYSAWALPQTHE